ncbi:MAG TPA: hypothetical protein PLN91_00545 [Rhodanobacteraceae bacterium]|nr:hypothetical protein [Rhodanobacteraceae bacterium]
MSEPVHLIAAGRLEAFREATVAGEISRKSRQYLLERYRRELRELIEELHAMLAQVGYNPNRCTPLELVVDRSPREGANAWLAWRAKERWRSPILPWNGTPPRMPGYRACLRMVIDTEDHRSQVLTVEDAMVVFLAHLDAWVVAAAEELEERVKVARDTPKARWESFVAATEAIRDAAVKPQPEFVSALLVRGRWIFGAEQRQDITTRWRKSTAIAASDAYALLGAVIADWVEAGTDASSQSRGKLAAAAARAQHIAERLAQALTTQVREMGNAMGLSVTSHQVVWR